MEGTRRAASGRRPFIGGEALTRPHKEQALGLGGEVMGASAPLADPPEPHEIWARSQAKGPWHLYG